VARKLVVSEFLSLDAVAEAPTEFVTEWDDEVDQYGARLIATQDAVLLGRRTYDEWSQFWPTSEIEPFASFINAVDKYVVTSTPPAEPWSNTTVVDGDLGEFVAQLKERPGGDIGVHGSIALTRSLLELGLVDELRLAIAPALQLHGRRPFDRGSPRRLTLTRHAVTPTGYLLLDYDVGA
jgi:dihydrofolate reductase